MLLKREATSRHIRSVRRFRSCSPCPAASAITSPLLCNRPIKRPSSSTVIFCGGNRRSNSTFSSSRLVSPSSICNSAAEILQPHGLFDDPVHLAQVAMLTGRQVGPGPHPQRPGRAGAHAVVQSDHQKLSRSKQHLAEGHRRRTALLLDRRIRNGRGCARRFLGRQSGAR